MGIDGKEISHDCAALFTALSVLLLCDCDETLLETSLVVDGAGNALVFGVVSLIFTCFHFGRQYFWFWLFFDGSLWLFLFYGFCLFNFFFLLRSTRFLR